MKVEIWSDFVCPFCYIGKRKFEAALAQFSAREHVEVVYRSFELDPTESKSAAQPIHEKLGKKYGMSTEQAAAMSANVAAQARQVGLDFRFDSMQTANTFDAHRLAHYAQTEGKAGKMTERLLHAYFTETLPLGDHATLTELAADVGLEPDAVAAILSNEAYREDVRADQQRAAQLGIRGVPFFLFDGKYAVSGAQATQVFVQALEQAWSARDAATIAASNAAKDADGSGLCTDEACAPEAR